MVLGASGVNRGPALTLTFIVPLERVHRLIAPSDLTEFLNQADWEIWPAQKEIDDWLARIMTLVFVCRSGTVKKRNPGDL